MSKLIIGSAMFIFGIFFLFTGIGVVIGLPLVAGGLGMAAAGFTSLGKTAVKAGMYVSNANKGAKEYSQPARANPTATSTLDNPAWKTLKEFDADVKAAVAQLSGLGRPAEERLASAYLAVNDKSLLPAMVTTILEESRKKAELDKKFAQEMAMEQEKRNRNNSKWR